jgi:trehalose 6-phosphate phosphatase
MKYIFSKTGMKVLESLTFTKTLYAFDYDGTLAPLVGTPDDAKISKDMIKFLEDLSLLAPIAIISGRSVSDLKSRLGFEPSSLIGNHGLEGLSSTKESSDRASKICLAWKNQLEIKWGKLKKDPGVFIEDKQFSLALHYRKSRNKKVARHELFSKLENLNPSPRIILGKSVMNLVPTGAPHKGVALLELMMRHDLKTALYIGDDDTDEDVFSLPDAGIISIRVGHKKSSQAHFFVKRQSEVKSIMREILIGFQKNKIKGALR